MVSQRGAERVDHAALDVGSIAVMIFVGMMVLTRGEPHTKWTDLWGADSESQVGAAPVGVWGCLEVIRPNLYTSRHLTGGPDTSIGGGTSAVSSSYLLSLDLARHAYFTTVVVAARARKLWGVR